MGKPAGKRNSTTTVSPRGGTIDRCKTISAGAARTATNTERSKSGVTSTAALDEDTTIFIALSQELKEEGNKLFQKRNHEDAMLKFEKALKLLPKNHIDVAYLRTSMAACYMQMGLGEYPHAIAECNLALQVSPKYSKALVKRSKCYEALNRLDLAWRDVNYVLAMEPNNLAALDVLESIKKGLEKKGIAFDEKLCGVDTETPRFKVVKERGKKKKGLKEKMIKDVRMVQEKEVVMDSVKMDFEKEKVDDRLVKLMLGEDIRLTQLPVDCSVSLLIESVREKFPGLKGVLIKYKDHEGDLVTITTTDELRLAESLWLKQGSLRLYVVEVDLDQEPSYEGKTKEEDQSENVLDLEVEINSSNPKTVKTEERGSRLKDWITQFAQLFQNHVGFDSDSCLDLHELGMKLYSEAMEDVVCSDDAQELFDIASDKFQEMAAVSMFNWGNVHLSKARRRALFSEDDSEETVLAQALGAYEWAKTEYTIAGLKYNEAVKINPEFYEGLLALGQQKFEQAKLCWYYAMGSKLDVENGTSEEVLDLYNKAEDYMERGTQMWGEMEEKRLNGLSRLDKYKSQMQKLGLDGLLNELSVEEAAEVAANMSSQIYLLWGTMLYERSLVEYRLELPTWEECLEVSIEKFELAGASPTDIAVMIKNHSSNSTAVEGMGFKIDEIVQAWNEMYDAKRWETGVPSFRLEPLFRRRVPKLHSMLEHVGL